MRKNTLTAILGALAIISVVPVARAEIASKEYVDDRDEILLKGTMSEQLVASYNAVHPGANLTVETLQQFGEFYGIGGAALMIDDIGYTLQQKLGGSENAGKVVTATGTPGSVTYTAIDSTPTAGSNNLITSGAVANAVADAVADADVSNLGTGLVFNMNDGTTKTTGPKGINSYYMVNGAIAMNSISLPALPAECSAVGGSCVLIAKGTAQGTMYVWENIGRETGETPPTTGGVYGGSYKAYGQADAFYPVPRE